VQTTATHTRKTLRETVEELYEKDWDSAVVTISQAAPQAIDELDVEKWNTEGAVPQKFRSMLETMLGIRSGEIDWDALRAVGEDSEGFDGTAADIPADEEDNALSDTAKPEPEPETAPEPIEQQEEEEENMSETDTYTEPEELISPMNEQDTTLKTIIATTVSYTEANADMQRLLRIIAGVDKHGQPQNLKNVIYHIFCMNMSSYAETARSITIHHDDSKVNLGVCIGQSSSSELSKSEKIVEAVCKLEDKNITSPKPSGEKERKKYLARLFSETSDTGFDLIRNFSELDFTGDSIE